MTNKRLSAKLANKNFVTFSEQTGTRRGDFKLKIEYEASDKMLRLNWHYKIGKKLTMKKGRKSIEMYVSNFEKKTMKMEVIN